MKIGREHNAVITAVRMLMPCAQTENAKEESALKTEASVIYAREMRMVLSPRRSPGKDVATAEAVIDPNELHGEEKRERRESEGSTARAAQATTP